MKFEIHERENKNYAIVDLSKDCLKKIKANLKNIEAFEIDENALNLGVKLYGENKTESVKIQKENCDKLLELYKVCVKLIKFLKHEKFGFDGVFYTKNLSKKKNNNDFMLCAMLDVKFNVKPFKRLSASYTYAADFLDMENSLNKMCDFHDNKCTKHRELDDNKTTGCCSKTICRFTCNAPCPTWNLSCKILMCDYLIEKKGYYFTPHTIPIMKKHFSYFERAFSIGQLCRTKKKSIFELWTMRAFGALVGLFAIASVVLFCV